MDRKRYIRYRIYVQTALEADRTYPRKLITSLGNLQNAIDKQYWERDYSAEKIISKSFTPYTLHHVGPHYYNLIAHFAHYFDCTAVWEKKMIKGTTKTINTFRITGYNQDALLAFHYISKIINNLEAMRFNMRREFRRQKVNRRRRGKGITQKATATTKASNFFYRNLDRIGVKTLHLLESKPINSNSQAKLAIIQGKLILDRTLDFRAYHYKGLPDIMHARCRKGKFQNRRLITVNY